MVDKRLVELASFASLWQNMCLFNCIVS